MRLSLETVSWPARLFAMFLAVISGVLVFFPLDSELRHIIETGNFDLRGLKGGFGLVFLGSIFSAGGLYLWALAVFGPPAILMNHIALWLRCGFLGFVTAGISGALLGFVIAGAFAHGIDDIIREMQREIAYRGNWSLNRELRLFWHVAVICGGGGAAVAWGFMWMSRRRVLPAAAADQ